MLERYGLVASSGRTLLRDILTTQGRFVDTDFELQPPDSDHPISKAIRGLPTLLSWPIDVTTAGEPMTDVKTWTLLTLKPKQGI